MPGMRPARKGAQAKGQGAAVAKQLGLLVDFNSDEMMMALDEEEDDGDLEAELAALTGKAAASKPKPKRKAPLPMDDIEKMAKDCMKDDDEEEEDEDLEQDEDLLAELQEVVGEDEEEEGNHSETVSTVMPVTVEEKLLTSPVAHEESQLQAAGSPAASSPMQKTIEDRISNYKTAIGNAKQAGESSKARRYERGLKTLESLLAAVKKGKNVSEEELPTPVATGKSAAATALPQLTSEPESPVVAVEEAAGKPGEATAESGEAEASQGSDVAAPEPGSASADSRSLLVARLKEYKLAALKAKQEGNLDKAKEYMKTGKKFSAVIEALDSGQAVDLSNMPPAPENVGTGCEARAPASDSLDSQPGTTVPESCEGSAREQLEFLEHRKKQYMKAAVQAKQKNDLEQAKLYLKIAKSVDPQIELAKSGKSVDISKLPSPPTDDESDFIFIHHNDLKLSEKTEEVYTQLCKLLKDQYEKCMQYSRQFTHLGNVAETTRFEKLAQDCKKSLEILQLTQAQGLDPPPYHFEERTFKIVRIFSELSSTEMLLIIVRGINLPAPSGVSPNDLDAFVKFEFHYPSAEQAQKNKTTVIKNTNSPEYDQQFKLTINRNHRGFKRVIQTKGMKFEIFHKGSFFLFKSDKQVGTAHLKLDKLESESEIREIIEVYDGRKPTGGKLEVKVRLREPLSGQDLQSVTERWLVFEQSISKN
ncbi:coiled-coil and C2 domain-containing protein 1B isoform X2 [Rhinatrema bivittatum]|uniref:coiled-coil and C2 domain-containing protein 1B isoform X2 n=1 Tax=Rhinatrema bivittatum TaxID=194408 RepID=UPI00112C2102|nr:coiled-coil and C2 domain-containing protein 1B isoform X2 [Rhinatrema bivittatum]